MEEHVKCLAKLCRVCSKNITEERNLLQNLKIDPELEHNSSPVLQQVLQVQLSKMAQNHLYE